MVTEQDISDAVDAFLAKMADAEVIDLGDGLKVKVIKFD